MMSVASFSAAASAAIPASSTALAVAVTCGSSFSSVMPSLTLCRLAHARPGISFRIARHARSAIPAGQTGVSWCPVLRWSVAAVQPAFGDVLHDPVRNQVPDGLPVSDPLAAVGRGDRQRRDLEQAHPVL